MTEALYHRGPDGEGQLLFENFAIGHRRLSIIDLSENFQSRKLLKNGRKRNLINIIIHKKHLTYCNNVTNYFSNIIEFFLQAGN